ncbi:MULTISPECIES: MFS transporter [Pseudomonas]|jgi:MFS family permease|uniref:Predicted arabinose efflux permease, MFS family n=1 Tax=Pseudomonas soli TaxID=1306993 RepID=A0A1H9K3C2_9PSED|nr:MULTISPECIES: MFS transporter [Pseudomonas]AUY32249.1 MFS transporter [Pseudomonas sp. PONIH3]MCX5506923.1 MFS transporter [Pseudomonas sp. BJa3]MDT3712326.1 MFS transporter [Pseudomonas soli]MDT3729663.1 MFS transporter [Pseudomonas soli]PYC41569.1 MFS transporter [Pseudomonas soli]
MSVRLLAMALAPLLGLFIIALGNGVLSSLTTLRLGAAGESATMIGVVSSAYFIGLTLGAIFNDRLILRIGHIRAYSSFAALIGATILLQGLFYDTTWWFVLRLINGWAAVGVFLVIESWLLLAGDAKIRGRLLALYMIAFYGAGVIAQAALGEVTGWGETAPFMVAGMLATLSVLPIVILPRVSPLLDQVEPLKPRQLLGVAPTGLVGCFGSGVAIAGIYALLPLYLQRIGLDVGETGDMMAWVILGAMLLQYPVGRWSDRKDRQDVLIALAALCTVLSVLIVLLPADTVLLPALLFLLGGGVFALYPVAVSSAADRAPADALVPMIQGLLLINSLGSAMAPLAISPMMTAYGEVGLFWAFAVINLVMVGFFLWRRGKRPAPEHPAPFAPTATFSPTGAELRVTEDLMHAAQEHPTLEAMDVMPGQQAPRPDAH